MNKPTVMCAAVEDIFAARAAEAVADWVADYQRESVAV
jgi:hypothetical protein